MAFDMEQQRLFYRRHKVAILRGWGLVACIILIWAAYSHMRPSGQISWYSMFRRKMPNLLKDPSRQMAVKERTGYKNIKTEHKHTEGMHNVPDNKQSKGFVHIYDVDASDVNATCVDYKMLEPLKGVTKLCVHNQSDDELVSGSFLKGGYWESQHLISIGKILRAHPEMVFMDIGSHMGMYTMYANKAGNQAIAIDPLTKNLRLLRKSVQLVNQEYNVVILLNAVSNKHEKLYMEQMQGRNIGSTHLIAADKSVDKDLQAADYQIQTILLDDLLEVFNLDNREVMMKMDVEGYEWKALQGGYEFFRRVNVCYVMMEFIGHKKQQSGIEIKNFMNSFNMFPYTDFTMKRSLSKNYEPKDYPMETIFVKHTDECRRQ